MAVPFAEYRPRLYDHVGRPLNPLSCSILKHHGIIIEVNPDPMKCKVIHYGGRTEALYRLRTDSLEKFIGGKPELHVYDHKEGEVNDGKEIENKIQAYQTTKPLYDFFTNNCEDIIIDILLKPENTYIKQYSAHSYFKLLWKGASFSLFMLLGGIKIKLLTLAFHIGFRKNKKLPDIDPLNFQDDRITDPNPRRIYKLKPKPMTIWKIGGYLICGLVSISIARSYYKSRMAIKAT